MRHDTVEWDLIDFPCSEDWISYYAQKGMTPDFPPSYYIGRLERRVAELEAEVERVRANKVVTNYYQPLVPQKEKAQRHDDARERKGRTKVWRAEVRL